MALTLTIEKVDAVATDGEPNASRERRGRVLLRSSWQMANIGDMAHAPSAIGLFARLAPDLDVVLWARRISDEERATLERWYPRLRVITGDLDALGRASTPELADELERCDFLLHGSGRLLAGEPDVRRWAAATGKPYGFFGISVDPLTPHYASTLDDMAGVVAGLTPTFMTLEQKVLVERAEFVYCRDSISVDYLHAQGVAAARLGPDAVFAFAPPESTNVDDFRATHGLGDDGYVCVVPRLRYTPYHEMLGTPAGQPEQIRDAINTVAARHELGVVAEFVTTLVRDRGIRVLVCPEMSYADVLGAEFVASLPDDVRPSVVAMSGFWSPSEATAVFAGASAVLSMECHSPILAGRVGVPSLYLRQPTDTIKGRMWSDLGMPDRILELQGCSTADLESAFAALLDSPTAREETERAARAAEELLEELTLFAAARIRSTVAR